MAITLLVAVGSAVIAPSEEMHTPVVANGRSSTVAVPSKSEPRRAVELPQIARYERVSDKVLVMDLFEPRIPPAQTVVAPAPVAPALPFKYMGRVEDQVGIKIFLVQGEQLHEATVGAAFAKDYRLDAITEDDLKITYLPLNIAQTLQIGAVK